MPNTPIEGQEVVVADRRVAGPTLIAEVPFSEFTTASTTIWPYWVGVLNRAARARTFTVVNSLDQPLASLAIVIYESTAWLAGQPMSANNIPLDTPGAGTFVTHSSEEASNAARGRLAAHADSIQVGIGIGATLPTKGAVAVYVTEVF